MAEEPERKVIELDDLEQAIYDQNTRIRPNEFVETFGTVWLDAGPQHFQVCPDDGEFESDFHADWYRRMLAKAMANVVKTHKFNNTPL